jgi:hypothetical protein
MSVSYSIWTIHPWSSDIGPPPCLLAEKGISAASRHPASFNDTADRSANTSGYENVTGRFLFISRLNETSGLASRPDFFLLGGK